MAEEKTFNWRIWFWRGSAVLLVVIFFVARSMTRDKLSVRAAAASRTDLVSTISTNGIVEPVTNYEFHSPLPTAVREIYVRAGDHVNAGTLLMQLDDTSAKARVASAESALRAAQASLEQTRAGGTLEERQSLAQNISRARMDLDQATRSRASLEKLQATGAASASEVASARQQQAAAQEALDTLLARQHQRFGPEELARAQAQVAEAEAGLSSAREVLQQSTIRASVAGTVYSIPVSRSDFVEEGRLLLQLADLNHERVRAYFDEPEIGKLAVGQAIRITWDARHGKEWRGHIDQVPSTIITAGTRNVGEVQVGIDDANDGLLPETHVTVTATTATEANQLTVPREALHSENGHPYVFRVVNGSLKRTPITVGTINLTQVAVQSGLSDGDMVATGSLNGLALEDGAVVKVVK
jgi:HlyD family secretion protein